MPQTPPVVGAMSSRAALPQRPASEPGDRILSIGGRETDISKRCRHYRRAPPGRGRHRRRRARRAVHDVEVDARRRTSRSDRFGQTYKRRPARHLASGRDIRAGCRRCKLIPAATTYDGRADSHDGRRPLADHHRPTVGQGAWRAAQDRPDRRAAGEPRLHSVRSASWRCVSINLGFINLLPVPMLDGGHCSSTWSRR